MLKEKDQMYGHIILDTESGAIYDDDKTSIDFANPRPCEAVLDRNLKDTTMMHTLKAVTRDPTAVYFWDHPGIELLYFVDCPELSALPELPSSVRQLYIINCPKLESLPTMTQGLTELHISSCGQLQKLKTLSTTVRNLFIENCSQLTEVPQVPMTVRNFVLVGCSAVEALPAIPEGVTRLVLSNCPSIANLPELPQSLTDLVIDKCHSLGDLGKLPDGALKSISVLSCPGINYFAPLPPSVEYMDIRGCENIESVPLFTATRGVLEMSSRSVTKQCDIQIGLWRISIWPFAS